MLTYSSILEAIKIIAPVIIREWEIKDGTKIISLRTTLKAREMVHHLTKLGLEEEYDFLVSKFINYPIIQVKLFEVEDDNES